MRPFTIVIPFRNGHETLPALLDCLPRSQPVLVVDDRSDSPPNLSDWPNASYIGLPQRRYFAGAVNQGMAEIDGDALILNQDIRLEGDQWLQWIAAAQAGEYAIAGHGQMKHPAWPAGYVQGQFMYLDRIAWEMIGPLNERDYPLWGGTVEWQLRACRKGYAAKPVAEIPGMIHARPKGESFGKSIAAALEDEPGRRDLLVRTPPLISVIVTSYNYGRYLRDCVASLIGGDTSLGYMPGQSLQSFEVILVNDGSTDETAEVCRSLADPWKAIRYIERPRKGGTPAANNTGIREAFGRYVTILCGDDMREPFALEALYRVVEQSPRAVAYDDIQAFGNGQRLDYYPDLLPGGKRVPGKQVMGEYGFDSLVAKNMMHAGIMFDRRAWIETGGYPEAMKYGREDWAFNIALGLRGFCGKRVPGFGYLYRREGQNRSLTNQGPEHRAAFVEQLRGIFPALFLNGVKPMGCCGGGSELPSQAFNGGGGSRNLQSPGNVGAEGMVLLEYLGGNVGTETFYGPITGQRYLFGGKRKQGWVDRRDALGDPTRANRVGFINMRDRGRAVFEFGETTPEKQEALAVAVTGAQAKAIDESWLKPIEVEPDPAAQSLEAAGPGAIEAAPEAQADPAPDLSYPIESISGGDYREGDPRELTIEQIKALLADERYAVGFKHAAKMAAMEKEGKNRKGVLDLLGKILDA